MDDLFSSVRSPSGFPAQAISKASPSGRRSVGGRPEHEDVGVRPHRGEDEKNELLWKLMSTYMSSDVSAIQSNIVTHVEYTLARTRYNFDNFAAYQATALSVRDRLIESWNDTQQYFTDRQVKRVYYLSLEFLMGRSLQNSIFNLGLTDKYAEALRQLGYDLESLYDEEKDAALGNGGLGRLAACFMDSLSTLNYPAWGYGIRYSYGMFQQQIIDGYQAEFPDYWLTFGNPWEIERLDVFYPISFYGRVINYPDPRDPTKTRSRWEGAESVFAVAYDTPIPGYNTHNTINIRLWSSKPSKEFDFASFNSGDYFKAIEAKQRSENISAVLYPNDSTYSGKELRLKQQFFFVSATLRDIMRRFKKMGQPLSAFPSKVAIQLNDTHPSIGIAELMRVLLDEEGLDWDEAWNITRNTYSFTNHTVLPEALEKWGVDLMEKLLPRHMGIIFEINWRFLREVEERFPEDTDRLRRMSIIEESWPKMVRMAHLAIIGSHAVNGVAAIHSEIIKASTFKDFYEMWSEKFQNKTNGVTPRRWLAQANGDLSQALEKWVEATPEKFLTGTMDSLVGLRDLADNPDVHAEWSAIRRKNKERLAKYIEEKCGVKVSPDSMFDVQIKRIHEYKRQLLNILGVIARYDAILRMTPSERARVVPRTIIIAGKAAPGYAMAKRIIKLINSVAEVVNRDPVIGDLLKVVFIPNYNVSVAEVIIPASDISQHISTAGTEASGTSNMKFAMNGCLILGTMDGANVEICEEIGKENMFIFGALTEQVPQARIEIRRDTFKLDPRLERVFDMIRSGTFGPSEIFAPILSSLAHGNDYYLLGYDFPAYMTAQAEVDRAYSDMHAWTRMSIMSTAGSGKFSSDRTIREYAEQIWKIQPCVRPYHTIPEAE